MKTPPLLLVMTLLGCDQASPAPPALAGTIPTTAKAAAPATLQLVAGATGPRIQIVLDGREPVIGSATRSGGVITFDAVDPSARSITLGGKSFAFASGKVHVELDLSAALAEVPIVHVMRGGADAEQPLELVREAGTVKGRLLVPLPAIAGEILAGHAAGPIQLAGDVPADARDSAVGLAGGKVTFVAGRAGTLRDVDLIVVVAGEVRDRTLRTCPYGTPSERHDLVQVAVDGDVVAHDRRTGAIIESTRFLAEATPCRKTESFRTGSPSVETVTHRWDAAQVPMWAAELVAAGAGGTAVVLATPGAKVGARVRSRAADKDKALYQGRLADVYGRFGFVHLDEGTRWWVALDQMVPPGEAAAAPTEACARQPGDRVKAPWPTGTTMWPGKVTEVYGKLAHIKYNDGDATWVECDRLK